MFVNQECFVNSILMLMTCCFDLLCCLPPWTMFDDYREASAQIKVQTIYAKVNGTELFNSKC